MVDFEFDYFGEEEGIEESEEFTDDYERRSVRVHRDGKKIRGKDMFWTKKIRFNNPREYEASNIIQELNEDIQGNESQSLNTEQCTTMSAILDTYPAGKKSE